MNTPLIKTSAKDLFFKAAFCYLANEDLVGAKRAIQNYKIDDPNFDDSRELELLTVYPCLIHPVCVIGPDSCYRGARRAVICEESGCICEDDTVRQGQELVSGQDQGTVRARARHSGRCHQ